MSTRSLLAKLQPDGQTFISVYSHHDGYLEWTGRILNHRHNTADKVDKLLTKHMSGLSANGGVSYYTDGETPYADPLHELHEVAKTCDAEWIYLWQPIKGSNAWAWHVATNERNAERRRDYQPIINALYTPFEALQDKLNNLGAFIDGASTADPSATPAEMFHPQFR